ncbi:MAG: class I SAM-dependent methyltransferase [Rubrivivax sp.]|nr:class I SAM-dependent methyltransferase [Rubrivivax sp.]
MPWPLPALTAWAGGWAVVLAVRQLGVPAGWDLASGLVLATVVAWPNARPWRRLIAASGFPISAALTASPSLHGEPALWLAALLPLVLLYPLRAWRDAPFFPTPARALHGLATAVQPAPRRVLDAGCGLGHGLRALQGEWPLAQLQGVEWSAPMAWLAAMRVPQARVERGDMWLADWSSFDLVYVFQRPESMARAWQKATTQMRAGSWLASLEFPVPGVKAHATLHADGARALHLYRLPAPRRRDGGPPDCPTGR